MSKRAISLLLVCLLSCLAGCGPGPAIVTGEVTTLNADGNSAITQGATVQFLRSGSTIETTTTDDSGHYRIELVSDTYAISVIDAQGVDWGPGQILLEAKSQETYIENIQLGDAWLAGGNLGGYVYQTLWNRPYTMPGAEIAFVGQDDRVVKAKAGPCGEYRAALAPGKYRVHASDPSYPEYADFLSEAGALDIGPAGPQTYNIPTRRLIGSPAPDSTWRIVWMDEKAVTEEQTIRLADYRGKVVLLFLAAVEC